MHTEINIALTNIFSATCNAAPKALLVFLWSLNMLGISSNNVLTNYIMESITFKNITDVQPKTRTHEHYEVAVDHEYTPGGLFRPRLCHNESF